MRKPVASSKANSSIIMVVKNGKKVFYVRNRLTTTELETNIWDLAQRRYRRAIRLFRENIDFILRQEFTDIPIYRDSDVSDIIRIIRNHKSEDSLALIIKNHIENKKNGK